MTDCPLLPYYICILCVSASTYTFFTLLENETRESICCDTIQSGIVTGNTTQINQRLSFLAGHIVTHVPLVDAVSS